MDFTVLVHFAVGNFSQKAQADVKIISVYLNHMTNCIFLVIRVSRKLLRNHEMGKILTARPTRMRIMVHIRNEGINLC